MKKNVKNSFVFKSVNLQKLKKYFKKITFFQEKKNKKKKKWPGEKMLLSLFSNIRRTQFDQSSPVHPVSESRGDSLSVTYGNPCVLF